MFLLINVFELFILKIRGPSSCIHFSLKMHVKNGIEFHGDWKSRDSYTPFLLSLTHEKDDIHDRESIVFVSNFRNEDFDEFIKAPELKNHVFSI